MPERDTQNRASPPCRWRSSDETLDVIEALERIEALLLSLDERLRQVESSIRAPVVGRDAPASGAGVHVG